MRRETYYADGSLQPEIDGFAEAMQRPEDSGPSLDKVALIMEAMREARAIHAQHYREDEKRRALARAETDRRLGRNKWLRPLGAS